MMYCNNDKGVDMKDEIQKYSDSDVDIVMHFPYMFFSKSTGEAARVVFDNDGIQTYEPMSKCTAIGMKDCITPVNKVAMKFDDFNMDLVQYLENSDYTKLLNEAVEKTLADDELIVAVKFSESMSVYFIDGEVFDWNFKFITI